MNDQTFAHLLKINPIDENSSLFQEFKKRKFFFQYFQLETDYFLLIYGKKDEESNIDTEFFLESIEVIQELNTRKRRLRSIRGFLLYAIELMNSYNYPVNIIATNFQPLFWQRITSILRQNKKNYLLQFLFGNKNNQKITVERDEILQKEILSLREELKSLTSSLQTNQISSFNVKNAKENYRNLKDFPENQQKEIIETGLELVKQKKLNGFEEYCEGDSSDSLFIKKGFRIKYETTRRLPIYKKVKSRVNN